MKTNHIYKDKQKPYYVAVLFAGYFIDSFTFSSITAFDLFSAHA